MSDPAPAERLRAEIRAQGPVTFARFMELALYGEHGYYASPPVGASGDFVTSPHVHEIFAALLGHAIGELRAGLGHPSPLRVTEVGAGDGTLARALLPALESEGAVRYTAVEISAGARTALAGVAGVQVASEPPLDEPAHITLANELLDNLPFRVVRDGQEIRVGLDETGAFVERVVAADDDLIPFLHRPDEVVPTGALAFVGDLARQLAASPGYALLIDYGTQSRAGTAVHGYADHTVVGDVLAAPGTTDITAGVDIDLLADRARTDGAAVLGVVSQHAALSALGFEDWFRGELTAQHRQLETGDGMGAVRTWSGKSRATLLADPAGLGRFRWLVLSTPGFPEPSWLRTATSLELG